MLRPWLMMFGLLGVMLLWIAILILPMQPSHPNKPAQ
jgi:hypothetical protein